MKRGPNDYPRWSKWLAASIIFWPFFIIIGVQLYWHLH